MHPTEEQSQQAKCWHNRNFHSSAIAKARKVRTEEKKYSQVSLLLAFVFLLVRSSAAISLGRPSLTLHRGEIYIIQICITVVATCEE
jgi:hypothetical protein